MLRGLLLLCLASAIGAWDCGGHALTAEVALRRLSPAAAAYFGPFMAGAQLRQARMSIPAELGCWPDDVKSFTSAYSSWHYTGVCYNPTGSPCPTAPVGHLPEALRQASAHLSAAVVTPDLGRFWVPFLLHLVADAHQPMHICLLATPAFPDGAGGRFYVYVDGRRQSLHHFHDTVAGLTNATHPARPIATQGTYAWFNRTVERLLLDYAFPAAVAADLRFGTWVAEGMADCAASYENGTLRSGSSLTAAYVARTRAVLEGRLALGGRRLAAMLERAFAAGVAARSPAPDGPGPDIRGYTAAGVVLGLVVVGVIVAVVVKLVLPRVARRSLPEKRDGGDYVLSH